MLKENAEKEIMRSDILKEKIRERAFSMGADLVGFAPASRWEEQGEVPEEFRPSFLWPWASTVIVLGMGMPLPVVETTPSAYHMELYNTVNRELDGLGYHLAMFLRRQGIPAVFFPRDGYGSIKIILEKPKAAFSHKFAAKYAGLGSIGLNGVLLTRRFGPRVRFVSVIAGVELEPDPMETEDLCVKCLACVRCCPVGAIHVDENRNWTGFDVMQCAKQAEELTRRRCYPCGICTKVCPVGEDRELFKAKKSMRKYLKEKEALKNDPDASEYRSWNHFRRWGSW